MTRQVSSPSSPARAAQGAFPYERAVVIGGSMVGLAVARALCEHFREVVIVDRDRFPRDMPEHRRGVPQSWHIHNLTLRGQNELEDLFPGFGAEAVALGAMQIDHALDVAAYTSLGWEPQFESGFIALSATRILLEFAERRRFHALMKNATLLEETRVLDLITEPRGDRLQAVGVLTDHAERPEIRADLVVDCAGRTSRWKEWLGQRNLPLPRETLVDSRCGYSSRFYRPHRPEDFTWKAMVVGSVYPHQPRWGVIIPLENKEWVVTLGGFNGQYPPSDEAGFVEFAKNLQTPLYYQAMQRAEPITPVRTFRRLEMRWNHFESYDHPVARFMAIGDSAWAYNPLYGQGMSIGVTCARIMRDLLRTDPSLESLPTRYYPKAKKFAWDPWEATALLDMRWPETTGKRPWHAKFSIPVGEFIVEAGHTNRAVSMAMLQGIHLLKQPLQLLTPSVIAGVALYGMRKVVSALPPPNEYLYMPPALGEPATERTGEQL